MMKAVHKAGRQLVRDFGEVENLQVSLKGPGDFVSAADRKAEETIIYELQKARPKFSFLGEEGGVIQGVDPDHRFIIDPLDGTTNFLHGLPIFASSVGLEYKGEMIAGVIHLPALNETYFAEKGSGAFMLNQDSREKRLRVSSRKRLEDSVIACGMPQLGYGSLPRFFSEMTEIAPQTSGLRRTGSSCIDLAWVAAGKFDGYFDIGPQPWDFAAGMLLVKEAGGTVTDTRGGQDMFEPGKGIIASAYSLHNTLQTHIQAAHKRVNAQAEK